MKGKFTLIVSGWSTWPVDGVWEGSKYVTENGRANLQLSSIPGFDSFYRCRAAGMELQARFNTDGYTLDFVCALTGK